MQDIRTAIYDVLASDNPMTVRQVFYQLVSCAAIGKTEAGYKQTVIRLLTSMRRSGEIPFGWIADNTRWMRKPSTYASLREMLELSKETYRRAVWSNQDAYVEVWLEKDALAGVLYKETAPWDVPLMVTRGYPLCRICTRRLRQFRTRESQPSFTTSATTIQADVTLRGPPKPASGNSHPMRRSSSSAWP
jgi:hypothetical protein